MHMHTCNLLYCLDIPNAVLQGEKGIMLGRCLKSTDDISKSTCSHHIGNFAVFFSIHFVFVLIQVLAAGLLTLLTHLVHTIGFTLTRTYRFNEMALLLAAFFEKFSPFVSWNMVILTLVSTFFLLECQYVTGYYNNIVQGVHYRCVINPMIGVNCCVI